MDIDCVYLIILAASIFTLRGTTTILIELRGNPMLMITGWTPIKMPNPIIFNDIPIFHCYLSMTGEKNVGTTVNAHITSLAIFVSTTSNKRSTLADFGASNKPSIVNNNQFR